MPRRQLNSSRRRAAAGPAAVRARTRRLLARGDIAPPHPGGGRGDRRDAQPKLSGAATPMGLLSWPATMGRLWGAYLSGAATPCAASSCQASSDPPVRLSYGLSQGVASQRLPHFDVSYFGLRRGAWPHGAAGEFAAAPGEEGGGGECGGGGGRGPPERVAAPPAAATGDAAGERRSALSGRGSLDLPVLKEALRRVRPCRRPPTSAPRRFVRGTRVRGAGRRGRGPAVLFEPSSRRCPVNCN